MSRRVAIVLALAALSVAGIVPIALGAEIRPGSCPAPATTWSATEKEVWQRFVCRGEVADLRARPDDKRKLSGTFLTNILLDEPWRPALPRQGVRIRGAVFDQKVTFDNADLAGVLWLEDCLFNREVFFSQTRSARLLSFDRSEFKEPLRLNAMKLGAPLFLRGVIAQNRIELWGTSIAGALFLSGSQLDSLFMQQANVASDVVIYGARIQYLQLGNATFGGNIVIGPTEDQPSIVSKMRVEASKVAGRITITDAIIETPIVLRFASIGGNLEINGGTLRGIDMTGATISGEFRLVASKTGPPKWSGDEPSILRNATARVIRIEGEPWPPKLDLRGFQFQLLGDGEDRSRSGARMPHRDVEPLLQWLGRSTPYSPQPYEQVAHVLAGTGDDAAAREVRYAAREEERRLAQGWKKAWLTAVWLVIGHGYHLDRALYWVIGLLIVGVLVVRLSGEAKRHNLGSGVAFSFDRLVPVVKLRDQKVELRPGVRQYFYVQQILGYVLASFLVAGLSGLTK